MIQKTGNEEVKVIKQIRLEEEVISIMVVVISAQ